MLTMARYITANNSFYNNQDWSVENEKSTSKAILKTLVLTCQIQGNWVVQTGRNSPQCNTAAMADCSQMSSLSRTRSIPPYPASNCRDFSNSSQGFINRTLISPWDGATRGRGSHRIYSSADRLSFLLALESLGNLDKGTSLQCSAPALPRGHLTASLSGTLILFLFTG